MTFQTAKGDFVDSSGDLILEARDKQGSMMSCSGTLALVHKPLIPAVHVSDKCNAMWVSGDGAYRALACKIQKDMRDAFDNHGKDTEFTYKCSMVHRRTFVLLRNQGV